MALVRPSHWLGVFPLALDLANTLIVQSASSTLDLLLTEADLASWLGAQSGRLPAIAVEDGDVLEMRVLREAVREVLFALAEGRQIPAAAGSTVSDWSAACPRYPVLNDSGSGAWV